MTYKEYREKIRKDIINIFGYVKEIPADRVTLKDRIIIDQLVNLFFQSLNSDKKELEEKI